MSIDDFPSASSTSSLTLEHVLSVTTDNSPLDRAATSSFLLADACYPAAARSKSKSTTPSAPVVRPPTVPRHLPLDLRADFATTLVTLSEVLSPGSPQPQTDVFGSLKLIISKLESFASQIHSPNRKPLEHVKSLYQAISCARTILAFMEDDPEKRSIRTGEVAEALVVLGDVLFEVGLCQEKARMGLYDLAMKVKQIA